LQHTENRKQHISREDGGVPRNWLREGRKQRSTIIAKSKNAITPKTNQKGGEKILFKKKKARKTGKKKHNTQTRKALLSTRNHKKLN